MDEFVLSASGLHGVRPVTCYSRRELCIAIIAPVVAKRHVRQPTNPQVGGSGDWAEGIPALIYRGREHNAVWVGYDLASCVSMLGNKHGHLAFRCV